MKRFLLLIFIPFIFLSCQKNRWTEFRGPGGQGQAPTSIQPPLGIKWQLKLQPQEGRRRFFNQPLLVQNTVYFGSADGNFYSLDLHSGFMNWTYRTQGPINAVASVDKDRIYFGSSDGFVYCVNRETGEELWKFETYGGVNSTLVQYEEGLIAASDADAFYYLTREGQVIYSIPNPVWYNNSFHIKGDILAFSPGTPQNPHLLTAYDLQKRRVIWALDGDLSRYNWFSFPAVQGNRLFYSASGVDSQGNWLFHFRALNHHNGNTFWVRSEQDELGPQHPPAMELFREQRKLLDYEAPLIWRNQVIFAPGDQTLRSFSTITGRPLWTKQYEQPVATAPTLAGGRIYFGLRASDASGGEMGKLICASPRNGEILWQMDVKGTILNSPVIAGSWVIFGTDRGEFYVLEELL